MKISKVFVFLICIYVTTNPLFAQAQIDPYKSLVIRDHKVLNHIQINSSLDFGYLLGDVGNWTKTMFDEKLGPGAKKWRKDWGAGHYVYYTLNDAALDQKNHEEPSAQKLGGNYNIDRTFRYILDTWNIAGKDGNELGKLNGLMNPENLKDSPFRLLAIVNRMDAAGDMDDRGTSHTTAFPRSFGEIHLIYGFIDKGVNYEGRVIKEKLSPRAYPATFVLAYRLPIIKWEGGKLVEETMGIENSLSPGSITTPTAAMDRLNNEFVKMIDHGDVGNRVAWKNKMSLWAKLWQSLSIYPIGSAQYNEKLSEILNLSIHPRNFLQLRSNFQVNEQEFELREWYIVQSTQALIKRKPRDEVYRCQSGQPELTQIVNYFWRNDYKDLDMTTRSLTERALQGGQDGYTIPRDAGVSAADPSLLKTILTPFLDTVGVYAGTLTKLTGCGNVLKGFPFEMGASGNAGVRGNRVVYAPPFARVQQNDVWEIGETTRVKRIEVLNGETKVVWDVSALADREPKRHAFAIRTCSGCHGQEAGAFGFHITPRLEYQNSKLSGFMTGVGANKFTKDGVTYQYNELTNRRNWLQNAIDKNAILFDSLKRNDKKP